jgi:hypothetical protein
MSAQMANVAGYVFNLGSVIAIDLTHYEATNQQRRITLVLVGPALHVFKGEAADLMNDWYLTISGQRQVQPVAHFPGLQN